MKNQLTKKLKRAWLKALKSGKYVQGAGELKTFGHTDRHCCLGVLCEIHPNMSISKDGAIPLTNKRNQYRDCNDYDMFDRFVERGVSVNKIICANDQNCDGKYTSVIPLIKALPTVD